MSNSLELEVEEYDGENHAILPEGQIKIEPRDNDPTDSRGCLNEPVCSRDDIKLEKDIGAEFHGIKRNFSYNPGASEGIHYVSVVDDDDTKSGTKYECDQAETNIGYDCCSKASILNDESGFKSNPAEMSVHYDAAKVSHFSGTLGNIKTEPSDFEQYDQDTCVPVNLHINAAALSDVSRPSECIEQGAARDIVARMKRDVFGDERANVAAEEYMIPNKAAEVSVFERGPDGPNSATHDKTDSSTRDQTCPFCGKHFSNTGNLRPHIRTHTGEKPYRCSFCDRGFGHSSHLQRHVQIHTREKTHKCLVCDECFGTPSELQKHSRSHAEERPFTCPVCNKTFRRSSHLRSHTLMHTGEKPYQCPTCDKSFNRPGHLNVHIRTHTGEKPYTCPLCNKGFSVSSHLQRHIRTHTGEKPHTCTVCGRGFSQSGDCQRHIRTHDKDV